MSVYSFRFMVSGIIVGIVRVRVNSVLLESESERELMKLIQLESVYSGSVEPEFTDSLLVELESVKSKLVEPESV